jgi:hypothetical protein
MGHGRPKGSRNKTTLMVKELLGEHAEEITGKVVALAKEGNLVALRLAMERLCPTHSQAAVTWNMPPVKAYGDLLPAYSSLLEAVANGDLHPREALDIKSILDSMQMAYKCGFVPSYNTQS